MTGPDAEAGVWVVVKNQPPETHCRTPTYLRGKTGRVVADLGCFRDPSLLAFHRPGLPMRRLFRVCFDQRALWDNYGPSDDKLFADLYEHWLEPATEQEAAPHA
jgi:hypothetical protein